MRLLTYIEEIPRRSIEWCCPESEENEWLFTIAQNGGIAILNREHRYPSVRPHAVPINYCPFCGIRVLG
jgi:hypothetical protein